MIFDKFLRIAVLLIVFGCNSENRQEYSVIEQQPIKENSDFNRNKEKRNRLPEISKSDLKLIPVKGLVYYNNKPFTGTSIKIYDKGNQAETIEYSAGKKDGFRRKFFPDGQISYEATYLSGKLHGTARTWWKNTNLRSEATYQNGVSHGVQRQWYKSGGKFKEQNISGGKEEGLQRAWRENGKIYNNYEAKNGRIFGLKRANLCYELEDENLKVKE